MLQLLVGQETMNRREPGQGVDHRRILPSPAGTVAWQGGGLCILAAVSNGDLVGQLDRRLEELARRWERFFARDRQVPTPPERERTELARHLRELSRYEGRTSAEQFRMEQLLHRFATYNNLWQRMMREREEARMEVGSVAHPPNKPAPAPVGAVSDEYQGVFARYVDALKKSGREAAVGFDSFKQTLEQQRRQLESGGSVVEGFEVVEDGAQVRVRARVRRGRQE